MQDTQMNNVEELADVLVHPDNEQRVMFIIDALPNQLLTEGVRNYFSKSNRAGRATRLFGSSFDRVHKEDVVSNLGKLISQDAEFVKWLVRPWLRASLDDLEKLRNNSQPEGEMPSGVLATLLWLSGNQGVSQNLLERLVKESTEIRESLDLEKKTVANLEGEKARFIKKLDKSEDDVSKLSRKLMEKEKELTRLAETHKTELTRKDEAHAKTLKQRTDSYDTIFKNHEVRVEQEKTSLIAELQRNHETAIQESLTKQQQELTARYESELTTLQAQLDDSVKVRKELEARLETLETTQQHSLEELQRKHVEQVQALQAEMNDLRFEKQQLEKQHTEGEVALANDEPPALLPSDDTFGHLLIFQYERGGADAVERLLTLFKAYRAFMKGESQNVYLTQVSNIDKFRDTPPEGLLVTDMARLLEDGANSALESFLNLRSLKQESVLRQLVSKLESPKFGEAS
jgi:hypothetical protein